MIKIKKNMVGFSLIELVIFIVIIGIAVSSVFLSLSTALQKTSLVNPQTTAIELASARMDIILGQRRINGFQSFYDLCSINPPVCTVAPGIAGYTISSTISKYTVGNDSNYKIIDVLVTGPQNSRANLKTMVAEY